MDRLIRTLRKAVLFPLRLLTVPGYRDFTFRSMKAQGAATARLSKDQLERHLRGAADWISRGQDNQPDGGIPAYFRLYQGWATSYPETTGYTIPTFLEYARSTQNQDAADRARRMLEFVLSTQDEEGWFPGGQTDATRSPSVFNSGMILHGLNHYYRHSSEERVLESAKRCGDWICSVADNRGNWSADTYRGLRRTYNTEVSASLAELYEITANPDYRDCAARANDWVNAQQKSNGWFANCDNSEKNNHAPLTHLIGYTARGLVVTGKILDRKEDISAARRCLEGLMSSHPRGSTPYLDGRLDEQWGPRLKAACVTGTAQLAVTLYLLDEIDRNQDYVEYADWLLGQVCSMQDLQNVHHGLRGGIPSSFPVWGRYAQLSLNNGGPKYFMDALMHSLRQRQGY